MSYPPGPPSPPPPGGGTPQGWGQGGYPAVPSQEERNWALAAHVGTFVAAWFAMGFLAPLVIMLVKGKDSAFVRAHAVESLNFQISLLIYLVISAILAFVLIGFVLLAVVGIFALVVIILATVKAANGEEYRYPLCIRLVS
jgi:uncharacterized Tic20 family protein